MLRGGAGRCNPLRGMSISPRCTARYTDGDAGFGAVCVYRKIEIIFYYKKN